MKCPRCGTEHDFTIDFCPNCGGVPAAERESAVHTQRHAKASSNKTTAFFGIAGVLAALCLLFFCLGLYKMSVYSPPSSKYSMLGSNNAYVGGDAYNYIINGTYFTGYMSISAGCLVSATICFVAGFCLGPDNRPGNIANSSPSTN